MWGVSRTSSVVVEKSLALDQFLKTFYPYQSSPSSFFATNTLYCLKSQLQRLLCPCKRCPHYTLIEFHLSIAIKGKLRAHAKENPRPLISFRFGAQQESDKVLIKAPGESAALAHLGTSAVALTLRERIGLFLALQEEIVLLQKT